MKDMDTPRTKLFEGTNGKTTITPASHDTLTHRGFLGGSVAATAALCLPTARAMAAEGKKTFTILHTNDMHASLIGMGPQSDYSPFTLNDDQTRGGYARLGALIAARRDARKEQGAVLAMAMGGLTLLCGLSIAGNPLFASAFLTVIIAGFLFADGVAEIVGAFSLNLDSGRVWMLLGGIASILLGAMNWRQFPLSGFWALGVLLGVRLLISGSVMLAVGAAGRDVAKQMKSTV
jgi:uncharacterized membrane protein HdeD (DUF308 family)